MILNAVYDPSYIVWVVIKNLIYAVLSLVILPKFICLVDWVVLLIHLPLLLLLLGSLADAGHSYIHYM